MTNEATKKVQATYIESAAATPTMVDHYIGADGKPITDEQRKITRNRSRQMLANDSTLRGMVQSLAQTLIGSRGPTLRTKDAPEVAAAWTTWARRINLAEILRTAVIAKARDGECFLALSQNPSIRSTVKLQPRIVDAARIMEIRYDVWGNPTEYVISTGRHGGDRETIDAANILHWFEGAETQRGLCEYAPALALLASLKDYRGSVLAAAELSARMAMVAEATGATVGDKFAEIEYGTSIDLPVNQLVFLPVGYKANMGRGDQQAQSYESLHQAFVTEAGRNLGMPRSISTGSAASYNFSSARIDGNQWMQSIECKRLDLEIEILEPLYEAFVVELGLSGGQRVTAQPTWHFEGFRPTDPLKENKAQIEALAYGLDSYTDYYASKGKDFEAELAKMADEKGITVEAQRKLLTAKLSELELTDLNELDPNE